MNLPDLPKIKKRKEAEITSLVLKWFEKNYPNSVALEIKIKGNKLLDHQRIALKQVQDGLFSYKIADTGRRNPFDGFVLKNADAFLVICDKHKCVAYSDNKSFEFKI